MGTLRAFLLAFVSAAGIAACRTTVYVSEAELSPQARAMVGAESAARNALATATPEQLEQLRRSRRATSEVLAAMARRDGPQLSARYGLRYDTPRSAELLRLVDHRSGPQSLEVRTMGDAAQRDTGSRVVLGVELEFRYRSLAGRLVRRQAHVDLHCLLKDGELEVVEVVPVS